MQCNPDKSNNPKSAQNNDNFRFSKSPTAKIRDAFGSTGPSPEHCCLQKVIQYKTFQVPIHEMETCYAEQAKIYRQQRLFFSFSEHKILQKRGLDFVYYCFNHSFRPFDERSTKKGNIFHLFGFLKHRRCQSVQVVFIFLDNQNRFVDNCGLHFFAQCCNGLHFSR